MGVVGGVGNSSVVEVKGEARAADDDGESLEERGGEPEGVARPDHAAETVGARGGRGALGKAIGQAF